MFRFAIAQRSEAQQTNGRTTAVRQIIEPTSTRFSGKARGNFQYRPANIGQQVRDERNQVARNTNNHFALLSNPQEIVDPVF